MFGSFFPLSKFKASCTLYSVSMCLNEETAEQIVCLASFLFCHFLPPSKIMLRWCVGVDAGQWNVNNSFVFMFVFVIIFVFVFVFVEVVAGQWNVNSSFVHWLPDQWTSCLYLFFICFVFVFVEVDAGQWNVFTL